MSSGIRKKIKQEQTIKGEKIMNKINELSRELQVAEVLNKAKEEEKKIKEREEAIKNFH